ncbi:MAG: histidine kinase [Bryobacterales bacterium]|nr:histidine kinase [Bryobacterales bacterium]
MRSRSLFWRLQIGGFLATSAAILWLFVLVSGDLRFSLRVLAIRIPLGFLLTLVQWRIYRRWQAGQFPVAILALRAGGVSIAIAAVDNTVAMAILPFFQLSNILPTPGSGWVASFLLRCLLYLAWSALYFGIRETIYASENELRIALLEAATRQAELNLLRAQVNTHFLFNALNAILAEVDDHPRNAKSLTLALTRYLHFSLRQSAEKVPFGEELDAMESYLAVQKIRFGDNLEYSINVPADAREARILPAALQPLVENAVKYGMDTSPTPLIIRVEALVRDGLFGLTVANTGHWVEAGGVNSHGIGLSSLRRRLQLLYGDRASLQHRGTSQEVQVEVRIPV